ncbi:hypothetical protein D9M72_437350 [compost metagenome]
MGLRSITISCPRAKRTNLNGPVPIMTLPESKSACVSVAATFFGMIGTLFRSLARLA